jgi:ABC-type transport system involved in multi-copper enzyme maturation permease subunit
MGSFIMAGITFREAARKKILWTAAGTGGGFLLLFAIALHFQIRDFDERATSPFIRYQILSAMLMVGLYVVDLLAVLMTILTSVDTISGEISSGTIHAIAMKPVSRWQILIGKWLGFATMITAFVALTFGGTIAVAYGLAGVVPDHMVRGGLLVLLECLLALTVTFLFGTWFSTLTTGVIVIGLYGLAFMGGWLEQMSGFTESAKLVTIGIVTSLIMPSEAIWRRAASEMATPLAASLPFSPFANV